MRHQDFITQARQNNKVIWDALHAQKALQAEWSALDYGSTLLDGEGENDGYTRSEVGSAVFATTDAIFALLASGHATNMAALL